MKTTFSSDSALHVWTEIVLLAYLPWIVLQKEKKINKNISSVFELLDLSVYIKK